MPSGLLAWSSRRSLYLAFCSIFLGLLSLGRSEEYPNCGDCWCVPDNGGKFASKPSEFAVGLELPKFFRCVHIYCFPYVYYFT